ncbi:MAG: 2-polyprenylphenol 6-hydroxylase [Beijerinckiaceae bacterium]|jgi:ubiquinone biosynthesis protein|nr:2-polyprenylphenol 6-hydroxylase [Beijerinckiaceae bacterium]
MGLFGSVGHFARLAHAGFVLAREGVFSNVDASALPPGARLPLSLARLVARRGAAPTSARLAIAIGKLGPSYVKLGQFLATRPDVVGPKVVRDLEFLQDRMEPFPREVAEARVAEAFGRPLSEVYIEFGGPVAAASIAQVHRARVRDALGERDVAVKVLRPGVQGRFARDLSDMYAAARLAERHLPDADRLRPVEVVDTLARSVRMEMDFRLEAAAASEFAENVADDPDFRIPTIDWDRTTQDVLTLEWIDGIPLTDIAALRRAGVDLPRLGSVVIQSFLRHALRDGFFHADMHQGNLFVDADGKLVAVDFGITGRLGPKERRFLAEILYGFITRDYRRVAEVHFEAGYVPETFSIDDFAQAVRAIGEPIHSRTADQISMAKLLTLLFEITALFDMKTRTELVMLQKTMVVVEGVGRTLDPKLDLWSTAEPVVRSWIEENLGPKGKIEDLGRNISTLARFANDLPNALIRGEKLMERLEQMAAKGVDLSALSAERIGRAEARRARSGHAALWVIALLLAIVIWLG